MGKHYDLKLVLDLFAELRRHGICYCHWKNNAHLQNSLSGHNDLDLLVSRSQAGKFAEILNGLGFKQALAGLESQTPGILDYYGYDQRSDRFAHVHVHYQLVFGHHSTQNCHLPVERKYLASVIDYNGVKIPPPEYELVLFVLRMIIRHFTWDGVLMGEGRLSESERKELAYLEERASGDLVETALRDLLPFMDRSFFEACVRSLKGNCSLWCRIRSGQKVISLFNAYARRARAGDIGLRVWRRVQDGMRRRIFRKTPGMQMSSGGLLLAIVGGDGSGKTTAVSEMNQWLLREFEVSTFHMGKPRWSWMTILIRGVVKIGRLLLRYPFALEGSEGIVYTTSAKFPGYVWLIHEVCAARDRYLSYAKARKRANRGALVICDRFPIMGIKLMDGPQVERLTAKVPPNRFIGFLARWEAKYYRKILPPDLLIALRVAPEIALQRRRNSSPESVRARVGEIWDFEWGGIPARVIDAGRSKDEVLSELKAFVWSSL
jgi:thymidylate kinase